MLLLAVNFHYVSANPAAAPRAIFPIATTALRELVEGLGRFFEFVSRDDLLAAVEEGAPLPERSCVITFDDGLRSQFELALPELHKAGVPAIFFVSGRPLEEGRALHVHRVHALREHLDEPEFAALLEDQLGQIGLAVEPVDEAAAVAMYRYDTPRDAKVKYLLNVGLDREAGEELVEAMFAQVWPDEAAFCRELYMAPEQVHALEHEHSALGSHGHEHHPFATLERDAQAADLARGRDVLASVTGRSPRIVSYPYGSAAAVTPEVAATAHSLGFSAGFTMERSFNTSLVEPLLLARVDVNDVPGGKSPLFRMAAQEPELLAETMTLGRRRYFEEAPLHA